MPRSGRACEIGVFLKPEDTARLEKNAGPSRTPAYMTLGNFALPESSTTQELIAHLSEIFGEEVEPAHVVSNLNAAMTHLQASDFLFLREGYSAKARSQPCIEYLDTRTSLAEQSPVRLILQRVVPSPAAPRLPAASPSPNILLMPSEPVHPSVPKQPQPQPAPPGSVSPPSPCQRLLGALACCCAATASAKRAEGEGATQQDQAHLGERTILGPY